MNNSVPGFSVMFGNNCSQLSRHVPFPYGVCDRQNIVGRCSCEWMKDEAGVLHLKKKGENSPLIGNQPSNLFARRAPRFSAQGGVRLESLHVCWWSGIITFRSRWMVLRGFFCRSAETYPPPLHLPHTRTIIKL